MTSDKGQTTRFWRLWLGQKVIHAGLRIMPPGRVRSDLTALLWTWNMKVHATVAAHKAINNEH